jgi:uncharacterized protein YigE (DUF2233 family)
LAARCEVAVVRLWLAWWLVLCVASLGCERGRAASEEVAAGDLSGSLEGGESQEEPVVFEAAGPRRVEEEAAGWLGQGPVSYREAELWARDGEMEVERQRWRFEGVSGWSWRVSWPRDAAAKVLASSEREPLGDLLSRAGTPSGAWAAINGGFYEQGSGEGVYVPMGVVLASGAMIQKYQRRGGSGILVVVDGLASVVHHSRWKEIQARKPTQALQSIDRIVDGGESLVKPREGARSAARSAVVMGEQRLWLIASAADGSIVERADGAVQLRGTGWQGMPLWAFASYVLETTDAQEALNLDGAVSVQLEALASGKRLRVLGELGTMSAVLVSQR